MMILLEEIKNFWGTPYQCATAIEIHNNWLYSNKRQEISVSFDKKRANVPFLKVNISEIAVDRRQIGLIEILGKSGNRSWVKVFYRDSVSEARALVKEWWKQIRAKLEEDYIDIYYDGVNEFDQFTSLTTEEANSKPERPQEPVDRTDRWDKIKNIYLEGSLKNWEIANAMNVSISTVYRDLNVLEEAGEIIRKKKRQR
jgi:hypothetical protein